MKSSNIKKIKPALKSFNCRNCGSVVEIKILGQTLNVTCPSCKSIIDANDPDYKVLQKGLKKKLYAPHVPLNSRGKLHGILWEIIGFLVKEDAGYEWQEYLLFNPYEGYRWLVEVNGHFAIYKRIHNNPKYNYLSDINYRGQKFRLFNKGKAKVIYVEGEFFWRVKRGDVTFVEDYIAPPQGLSLEKTENEQSWTFGHYVKSETIKQVFKVKGSLLQEYGVGALQPSPFKESFQQNFKWLIWSLLILTFIHVLRSISAENELVYQRSFVHQRNSIKDLEKNQFKSETFHLSGGKSNVKLSAYANVSNSWIYLDALLVDAKTQKGIPIPLEVSYYFGSDWSEGSRRNSEYIFNVPDGDYYLNIRTEAGGSHAASNNISIELYRDGVINLNLWIAYILIIIGPLFILFKRYSFEKRRWSNSDYSPYESDD